MFTIHSGSQQETIEIGERLGATLEGGEVLALTGELGAGKTVFVKGVARGLGIEDVITSPTFVLVKSYIGRLALHHIDFYRLETKADLGTIGFGDFFGGGGVVAIEWAEKFISEIPGSLLQITFIYEGEGKREIHFRTPGVPEWERRLAKILLYPPPLLTH